ATSQITLQFDLDRNIDAAAQDVQAAINATANLLPPTLPAPPTYSKSNPADTPVLALAISSEILPLPEVDNYADSVLAQKISVVIAYKDGAPIRLQEIAQVTDGVENAQLAGWAGRERAIILNVQRQPGANVIEVTSRVKALLAQLQASMPQSVDVEILSDRTE